MANSAAKKKREGVDRWGLPPTTTPNRSHRRWWSLAMPHRSELGESLISACEAPYSVHIWSHWRCSGCPLDPGDQRCSDRDSVELSEALERDKSEIVAFDSKVLAGRKMEWRAS
ncbi:hypothetical protein CRG98_016342 [Punica granatum]|uniref:Uncharacterized protein n=1 Tax=Punica granatum TaxID=22663 RepID=A0A2I0K3N3_PUNGR|nr:hypothetical protein CRG98_016342 [Punica granatum]